MMKNHTRGKNTVTITGHSFTKDFSKDKRTHIVKLCLLVTSDEGISRHDVDLGYTDMLAECRTLDEKRMISVPVHSIKHDLYNVMSC